MKTRQYFIENHSLEDILESLLRFSQDSTLSWKAINDLGFFEKGYFYKLFFWSRNYYID